MHYDQNSKKMLWLTDLDTKQTYYFNTFSVSQQGDFTLKTKLQLYLVPQEKGDRCHRFWPPYSIDVMVEGKRKGIGKKNLEQRWGIGYFLLSIEWQAKSNDIYPNFARALQTATTKLLKYSFSTRVIIFSFSPGNVQCQDGCG